ncbi:MAG: response regulator [Spirochaetaceae bacterium]|jgi:putative two-component system response regulator|nr:response regulator [Spirochaetaceae bacterium]
MAFEKKVFLVDDNTTNLVVGKNCLKERYQTYTMSSAEKMFELLEKIQPDVILLDIEMPGISGYEAYARLKESGNRDIPVIFVTGNDTADDEAKCLKLGAAGFVRKPFTFETISAAIDQLG